MLEFFFEFGFYWATSDQFSHLPVMFAHLREFGSWEKHTKGFGMKMLQQVTYSSTKRVVLLYVLHKNVIYICIKSKKSF